MNKAPVYYPPLAQSLNQLGENPTDAKDYKEFIAIVDNLIGAANTNSTKAGNVAQTVPSLKADATNNEKKLRIWFNAYDFLYLQTQDEKQNPILPPDVEPSITAIGSAWERLSTELDTLKQWVDTNVKTGTEFKVDISSKNVVDIWKQVAESANEWRTIAYVHTQS